jgi:hypothetical protein
MRRLRCGREVLRGCITQQFLALLAYAPLTVDDDPSRSSRREGRRTTSADGEATPGERLSPARIRRRARREHEHEGTQSLPPYALGLAASHLTRRRSRRGRGPHAHVVQLHPTGDDVKAVGLDAIPKGTHFVRAGGTATEVQERGTTTGCPTSPSASENPAASRRMSTPSSRGSGPARSRSSPSKRVDLPGRRRREVMVHGRGDSTHALRAASACHD